MTRLALTVCALAVAASGAAPDASNGRIAFVRCCAPAGIFVIGPDGSGERRLYRAAFDDAPLTPAWSPDGKLLAFVPGAPRGGIWTMRANGSQQRRVIAGKGDPLFPSFAPDGSRIAFSDLGKRHDVYVVRRDGSGLTRLTRSSAEETHPAWSPSRGEIVYEHGRDLWLMRADGSRQRRLVRNASSPAWSPGGAQVAFVRGGDLWTVRRDGSGARRVADLPAEQIGVAWSPDGRWLVSAPADRGDLMLVRIDGLETRPLTDAGGFGHAWPSWQRR